MEVMKSRSGSRSVSGSLKSSSSALHYSHGNPPDFEASQPPANNNSKFSSEEKLNFNRQDNDDSLTNMDFLPWRVFINHIDSYHGKKLTELLTEEKKTTQEDDEVDEENEEYEYNDDEDDPVKTNINTSRNMKKEQKLEIIGTVRDGEYKCPEDVATVMRDSKKNRELLLREVMKCGVVIYDITQDDSQIEEANWALEAIVGELSKVRENSPESFEESRKTRYFVLISTLMTWALTKPLDPENADLPFEEADYRKRKPHPNFKEHIKCERNVLTISKRNNMKNQLKTVVLGAGITYGDEEGPLHYLFKMGWKNADFLPVFGNGMNKIPLLHVRDLAGIVRMIIKKWPKIRYVVAAEQEPASQITIVKKISTALTTGKVETLGPEEAFLLPELSQRSYDMINVNLDIVPGYIIDNNIDWHSEMLFTDNVDSLVEMYKKFRNLYPVKIVILGPPASGKTYLARRLANHYGLHHIQVKSLIEETVQKLTKEIENARDIVRKKDTAKVDFKDLDGDEDEKKPPGVHELEKELAEIRNNLAENNGRLPDNILNKLYIRRLESKDCQNQGYVLDGYPKTLSQAENLFKSNDEEESEKIEEDDSEYALIDTNRKILPELVVVLEADDQFLIERVIRLTEKEVQGTHYNEEGMNRRLREYRERNTDEESPLDFFNELEMYPLVIPVESDACPEMFSSFVECIDRLGEPRNYGPSDLEKEQAKKRIEAEAQAKLRMENARREHEDFERRRERQRKMMEWTDLLDKLKHEEDEQLCAMVEPLRHYLVKYIFPTLTKGLIEVAKLRPEDPIDYLAEFLFRENPEGKMFEPDYTETMSMLLDAIEKLQEKILPLDELDTGNEKYLKDKGQPRKQDAARPCRTHSDETEILTEDDEDEKRERKKESDSIKLVDLKSSSARTSPQKIYKDESGEDVPSKFSYEKYPAGSRNSIESSSNLSLKNSP